MAGRTWSRSRRRRTGRSARPTAAEETFRHARVRLVEPGVTLQSAAEPGAEEAVANMPFLPGDRVWTDNARARRVPLRRRLAAAAWTGAASSTTTATTTSASGQVVLRLWSGSVLRAPARPRRLARVRDRDARAAAVTMRERGVYRVDVDAGETRLSALRGRGLPGGRRAGPACAAASARSRAAASAACGPGPLRPRARATSSRAGTRSWATRRTRARSDYLPEEVSPFAEDFERNGSWYFEAGVGNVWRPHVSIGWRPYTNGRWAWTAYGWTWVPNESWGWAPFHYGRWDHSSQLGWYWIPGRTWGPAWVSWSVSNDHVGWCPLGYRDRPVVIHERGPRGAARQRRRRAPGRTCAAATWARATSRKRRVDAGAVADRRRCASVETGRARVTREGTVAEGRRAAQHPHEARARRHRPGAAHRQHDDHSVPGRAHASTRASGSGSASAAGSGRGTNPRRARRRAAGVRADSRHPAPESGRGRAAKRAGRRRTRGRRSPSAHRGRPIARRCGRGSTAEPAARRTTRPAQPAARRAGAPAPALAGGARSRPRAQPREIRAPSPSARARRSARALRRPRRRNEGDREPAPCAARRSGDREH